MLSWREIRGWEPSEISRVGHRIAVTADNLASGAEDIDSAVRQLDWSGAAADAAKTAMHAAAADYLDSAQRLRRVGKCIADATERMYPLERLVRDCESTSRDHRMPIQDDGAVVDSMPVYATSAEGAWVTARARMRTRRELEAAVGEVLRRAVQIDTDAAAELRTVVQESLGPNGSAPTVQAAAWTGSAPADASRWNLLTQSERTSILVHDPGSIGNRDGIPAEVRDAANRRMLVLERTRLHRVAQDLAQTLDTNVFGGLFDNADAGLNQTMKRLAALDAISDALAQGDRQLLVLDNSSGMDTLAAISVGNVDTATHVAVFVPGLDSEVRDDVHRYDGDMDALRIAVQQLVPRTESVACVTWMDYQAPQLGWSLLDPRRSVVSPMAAAAGAPRLASFLDGLDAARSHDPHLTVLGHSYGSLTAALALRGTANTGVDDMVALGSPGLGFDSAEPLAVPPGHLFVGETPEDFVADTGFFGADPSEIDGVRPLATRGSGEFADSHGHSEYLTDRTTAQHNVALVVAGRTDEVSG